MPNIPTHRADGSPALSAPEAIAHRRATRHFDLSKPMADDLLKEILLLATLAPSGYNLQPWRFLVVRSEANRQKLRRCAYGQAKIREAPVVVIVLGYQTPHGTHLHAMVNEQIRRGAITTDIGKGMVATITKGQESVQNRDLWATRSTMLASATMMIAAESLGVATAPMEGFDDAKIRPAFGIPDDHVVCCLIALGFASGEEKPFPGRFGLEEVCYLEHFGQPWTLGEA